MPAAETLPTALNSPFRVEAWTQNRPAQFYLIPKGTLLDPGDVVITTLEDRALSVSAEAIAPHRCSLLRFAAFQFAFYVWVFIFFAQILYRYLTRGESVTHVSADLLTRIRPAEPTPPRTAEAADIENDLAELQRLHAMAQAILSREE